LVDLGMKVQVGHPGKLRLIFQTRKKNDRIDARKLAKLLYLDEVPLSYVPSEDLRQWRAFVEFRRGRVVDRARIKHRLRALLKDNGVETPRKLWTKKGLTWLAAESLPEMAAIKRDMLVLRLAQLVAQIKQVEKVLARKAAAEAAVGLLRTIPGVGVRTAEAVVVYMADPERFRRNNSVGCYFGMVPCEDTSVKSRFGHITKEGPPTVRWLVTEATWQAIRRDASLRAYYERIRRGDANRKKIALVATAHHLLRAMHAMLCSGEVWRSTPREGLGQGGPAQAA
jgi:transposase